MDGAGFDLGLKSLPGKAGTYVVMASIRAIVVYHNYNGYL
jgi:hypothetical protein